MLPVPQAAVPRLALRTPGHLCAASAETTRHCSTTTPCRSS